MANRNVHTVHSHNGGWTNKVEGNARPLDRHHTQAQAINAGRNLAKILHAEHLIHGRDGQIRERNRYGHDPFPPRG